MATTTPALSWDDVGTEAPQQATPPAPTKTLSWDDVSSDRPVAMPNATSVAQAAPEFNDQFSGYYSGLHNVPNFLNENQKANYGNLAKFYSNKPDAQAAAINQNFVQTQLPDMPPAYLAKNWESVKVAYAKQRFGMDIQNMSDTDFYQHMQDTFQQVNDLKNQTPPKPWDWKDKAATIASLTPFVAENFWRSVNPELPLEYFPEAPTNLPNINVAVPGTTMIVNPAVMAGTWNGLRPQLRSILTPVGVGTGVVSTELQALKATSPLVKALIAGTEGVFGVISGYAAYQETPEFKKVMSDPNSSLTDKVAVSTRLAVDSVMALATGWSAVLNYYPPAEQVALVKEIQSNPKQAVEILKREEESTDAPGHAEAIKEVRQQIEQSQIPTQTPVETPKTVEEIKPTEAEVIPKAVESEPTVIGPKPDEIITQSTDIGAISIKNEIMANEMRSLGYEEPTSGESKTFEGVVNNISEQFKNDSTIGARLVDQLTESPRAPSAEENVILGFEARRLKNERIAAEQALINARDIGDTESEAAAQKQIDLLRDQFAKTANLDRLVGTASGQSLAFRKVMLKEDYSLASLERKLEVAKGEKLTPQETEELRDTATKLQEKERKLKDVEAKQRGELPGEESIDKEYAAKKQKLEDEIKTLKKKISEEVPIKKSTQKPLTRPEVEEIEMLSQERDDLKDTLSVKTTRESQVKSLQEQIINKERQIKEGDFSSVPKSVNRPAVESVEILKQQLEDLRAQYKEAKESAMSEVKAEEAIRKRIESLDNKIQDKLSTLEGKPQVVKGKLVNRPQAPEIEQRLQLLDELNKRIAERAKRTPEEISAAREQARIKAYETRTKNLKEKLAKGDITREERRSAEMSPEVAKARAEYELAKQEFNRKLFDVEQSRRSLPEKGKDLVVQWRRAGVLSRAAIVAKLSALVAERAVVAPIRQGIGLALSKTFPSLARQGRLEAVPTFSGYVRSEAKALTALFTKGLPGAVDILKGRPTDLEATLGKVPLPRSMLEYTGTIHKALHYPIQVNDYVRRLSLINERDLRNGIDMKEPMNQLRNMQEAFEYSQRAIYTQNNRLVSGYEQMLKTWEGESKKSLGSVAAKSLATLARIENPVVKVPVNVALELTDHVLGLLPPAAKLLVKGTGGFEGLSVGEADQLLRHLKNGSLGAFLALYGFFKYKQVGGFYEQGEKRPFADVKPGELKVGGVKIPSYLLKDVSFEVMNSGSTLHRTLDQAYRLNDPEKKGIPDGLLAIGAGLADEMPFIKTQSIVGKFMDPRQRARVVASQIADYAIPGVVQEVGEQLDKPKPFSPVSQTVQRKGTAKSFPAALGEEVKARIPGLRQTLPKRDVTTSNRTKLVGD